MLVNEYFSLTRTQWTFDEVLEAIVLVVLILIVNLKMAFFVDTTIEIIIYSSIELGVRTKIL